MFVSCYHERVIDPCEWPLETQQMFLFMDFKDVISELRVALHAESKMIIFTSGLLQGFT